MKFYCHVEDHVFDLLLSNKQILKKGTEGAQYGIFKWTTLINSGMKNIWREVLWVCEYMQSALSEKQDLKQQKRYG